MGVDSEVFIIRVWNMYVLIKSRFLLIWILAVVEAWPITQSIEIEIKCETCKSKIGFCISRWLEKNNNVSFL